MLKLTIISIGKLKETYWQEAAQEYTKRIKRFAQLELVELKEISFGDNDDKETVKVKEAARITEALPKSSFVIVLDERGEQITSQKLAQKIQTIQQEYSHICFVIGGSLGLHETIKNQGSLVLSLSSFTFTHEMAKVFLIEQLYRAFMISSGSEYHH